MKSEYFQIYKNISDISATLRNCYKQLNTIKLDNWEEMDAFLETYNILRQNQEEIESLERSIMNRLNQ